MPVRPGAIDRIEPVAMLLAPARPLPAAPQRPDTNRPQTGEAVAPKTQALHRAAAARVRGPIGSVSTVGPNAARIGAPGLTSIAQQHAQVVSRDARQAIGGNVDARA